MEQYIPKSALVAEIKRYKHKADERLKIKGRTLAEDCKDSALQNLCGNLLHFIDTLEVKEVDTEQLNKLLNWWKEVTSDYSAYKVKGVDLEKEISEYFVEHPDEFFSDKYKLFAQHFFELGLKAQKGK